MRDEAVRRGGAWLDLVWGGGGFHLKEDCYWPVLWRRKWLLSPFQAWLAAQGALKKQTSQVHVVLDLHLGIARRTVEGTWMTSTYLVDEISKSFRSSMKENRFAFWWRRSRPRRAEGGETKGSPFSVVCHWQQREGRDEEGGEWPYLGTSCVLEWMLGWAFCLYF